MIATGVYFILILGLFLAPKGVLGGWREDLYGSLKETGEDRGGYLCFYFKAKLSFVKGMSHIAREKQLAGIRKECNTKVHTEPESNPNPNRKP